MNIELMRRHLEVLSDRSMPGRERHMIGRWVCRAANGVTSRSNSCTPFGHPKTSIEQAVDEAERWFEGRGLRTVFQIWDGCSPEVVEFLADRGYTAAEGADVVVRQLRPGAWPAASMPVEIEETVAGECLERLLTPRLEELMMSQLPKIVGSVSGEAGAPSSFGVGVLDDSALGIFATYTDPERQRQGHGMSVLSSLLHAGAARKADLAWLQVMHSNTGAKLLYEDFGFEVVHAYHYRGAPIA